MQYLIKFLNKENKWNTATISLPDTIDVEAYVEKNFAKDFIIYTEHTKSKERVRKETLIAESKFDLLRQG